MSAIRRRFDPLGIVHGEDEALLLPPEDSRLHADLERAKGIAPKPCPRCGYVEGDHGPGFTGEVAQIGTLIRLALHALRKA